jgi:hypothetical protein
MKKRHPRLKDVIIMETPPTPSFKHYGNIHIFIQAFIQWLHDEKLRNYCEYSDKEKLDHVLNNLNKSFKIALLKIEKKINSLYADTLDPQPLSLHLQVTNDLRMYITNLIPNDKKDDLTNRNVPKLFAVKLSNMPSHVILTPRDAADDKLPTYASKLSDNQCAHLKTVGKALVEIMDNNLKAGRDLLQDLLKCGEIRKLDAAIANAMKQDKIGMSFFTVLNMNIRDAAMEQVDEGSTLSKTEEGEFSTGDNANRYQILQHIYTRCQEEVEKTVSPGAGLLNKLLRTDQDTIRANQLRHYLCPQAPKTISSPDGKSVELPGSDALVKPSELIDALQNAVKQIRTVEKTGTVDVSAAAALVESCRQVAIEARLAVGEGYGIESEELKEFELSLQPVFRPDNADSEYIKGV